MADEQPKYDVAISFLYQDLSLAQALHDKLCRGFEVFFFPGSQEVLAGTDGLESMRQPFRHESRVNVVLFRPEWGKTRWTAVEELAIKESCLDNAYRNLFVYVIEGANALPKWLPDSHVYFNSAHYSLDDAVGAIKARVLERGGEFKALTPLRKAELNRAEEKYRNAKSSMSSPDGLEKIVAKVMELFEEIRMQCDEVNAAGHAQIDYEKNVREHSMEQVFTISADRVGLVVVWFQRYSNSLDGSFLVIREFSERMILQPGYMHFVPPQAISEAMYEPDISRAFEYGWTAKNRPKNFLSSKDLAARCVIQFLDLINRDRDGKVQRNSRY
jgi:hypothetical protein